MKRPSYRYPYRVDGKSWHDTRGRTVESLIPRMLADFKAVATRMQQVDDERGRLEHECDVYYRVEARRFSEELQRLLGHHWEHAENLVCIGQPHTAQVPQP